MEELFTDVWKKRHIDQHIGVKAIRIGEEATGKMLHEYVEHFVPSTISKSIRCQGDRRNTLDLTPNELLDEVTKEFFAGQVPQSKFHYWFGVYHRYGNVNRRTRVLWSTNFGITRCRDH